MSSPAWWWLSDVRWREGGVGLLREVVVVGQAKVEPRCSTTAKLTDHSRSTSTTFEGSPNRLVHYKYLA